MEWAWSGSAILWSLAQQRQFDPDNLPLLYFIEVASRNVADPSPILEDPIELTPQLIEMSLSEGIWAQASNATGPLSVRWQPLYEFGYVQLSPTDEVIVNGEAKSWEKCKWWGRYFWSGFIEQEDILHEIGEVMLSFSLPT